MSFKLYINKVKKDITVTLDGNFFFYFNYYIDTVDHRIPHILHKALTDELIIPAIAFDLQEVHAACIPYYTRVFCDFPERFERAAPELFNFDPNFVMLYDIFYCNIIVNNYMLLPAICTGTHPLSFTVFAEDLDRHIVTAKYGALIAKGFKIELNLINKLWYEKII